MTEPFAQNFRAAAQKAMISVKKDEYDIAKQEVLKAQMKIDQVCARQHCKHTHARTLSSSPHRSNVSTLLTPRRLA